jgi:hypothetical protein
MQDKYLLKLTHVWYQYHSQQVRIMIIQRDQNHSDNKHIQKDMKANNKYKKCGLVIFYCKMV